MKRIAAMIAGLALAASAGGAAHAGVVIDEQVTNSQANGPSVTHTRELMVQGHKEKLVSERNSVVIDLDKGTMILIDPGQKVFAEMPFPPHTMMAANTSSELNLNFKKTGKQSKVIGYSCSEYAGAGKTMIAAVTTTACFSNSAPGAAEFSEFTKAMAKRLQAAKAMAGAMPDGIPLTMVSTRTMSGDFAIPGLPSAQATRLKEMMAKQGPQTTKTEVIKVATRELPADTFQAPAGYERRGAPPAPTMPKAGNPGTAGARTAPPIKVPE
ncbi:MAG TPA: DUF4412 domain-containing protein [Candidatus Binataceae bacterium]|nr:DUF4412 domain-containing protein [Candidatus Binataceae bacterium]